MPGAPASEYPARLKFLTGASNLRASYIVNSAGAKVLSRLEVDPHCWRSDVENLYAIVPRPMV